MAKITTTGEYLAHCDKRIASKKRCIEKEQDRVDEAEGELEQAKLEGKGVALASQIVNIRKGALKALQSNLSQWVEARNRAAEDLGDISPTGDSAIDYTDMRPYRRDPELPGMHEEQY